MRLLTSRKPKGLDVLELLTGDIRSLLAKVHSFTVSDLHQIENQTSRTDYPFDPISKTEINSIAFTTLKERKGSQPLSKEDRKFRQQCARSLAFHMHEYKYVDSVHLWGPH